MVHLLGPYLMLWMSKMGLDFAQIGLTQACCMAAALLLDFPTGGLADKYGRRLSFGVGMLFFGLGYGTIALAHTPILFTLGFVLAGCGSATGIVEGVAGPVCGVLASAVSLAALNLPIGLSGAAGLCASFVAIVLLKEDYGGRRDRSYRRVLRDGLFGVLANGPLLYLILSGFFMSFVMPAFMLYWVIILRDHGLPEAGSRLFTPLGRRPC